MENHDNTYAAMHQQMKSELLHPELESDEKCIFAYSAIPWFPGGQISLFLICNTTTGAMKLVKKTWDSDYDVKRFSSGIYSLNKLCIETSALRLSPEQREMCSAMLDQLPDLPESLETPGSIVVDGTEYEMTISINHIHKNYQWRTANNNLDFFKPLIEFCLGHA